MKVVEKFISINGEGVRAGELAVFVRFKGCNLRCSYCDTMWANEKDCLFQEETPREICEYIVSTGVKNVTLTGGEPLLQKEMPELIGMLMAEDGIRTEIETNGAVDLEAFCQERKDKKERLSFTMDYKLPSSGMEEQMIHTNFFLLCRNDTVKFVTGSREDMDTALEIIKRYGLTERCHVYFSPVFGAVDPASMVDFMIRHKLNDARLQIQIHKVIWDPEKRGV